jgi:hypothetical protein
LDHPNPLAGALFAGKSEEQRLPWQRRRLTASNRQDFASRAHIRGE